MDFSNLLIRIKPSDTTKAGTPNATDRISIGKFFNSNNIGTSLIIAIKNCPITVIKIFKTSNINIIISPSFLDFFLKITLF